MRNAVVILSMLCCTLLAWGQAQVHWIDTSHDFGTFKEEKGKVSCTMRLVNAGDSILVITRVQSTCGCTATEYPHTGIEPGDTASVTLTYNPYNRPGRFEKDVYVYTNGKPRRSRLTITGKVIGAEVTVDEKYPVRAGSLRLEVENVPLGEMYRGSTRNAYINAYNASRDTLVVTVDGNLPHVSLNAAPDTVPPGEASAVVVHYDTRQAPLWGFNADTLLVMSEPLHNSPTAIAGLARIYVMAQVLEDMSKLTSEQLRNAPDLEINTDKVMLPGHPDIVIGRLKVVIFVNGCFWHGHSCQRHFPETNKQFWTEKIYRNRNRDYANHSALESMGWFVIVLWECQLTGKDRRNSTLDRLLNTLRLLETPEVRPYQLPVEEEYPQIAAEDTVPYGGNL